MSELKRYDICNECKNESADFLGLCNCMTPEKKADVLIESIADEAVLHLVRMELERMFRERVSK